MHIQKRSSRHVEHFVDVRRSQDDRINFLTSKLKQEAQMKEFARFENKGNVLAVKNDMKQNLAKLREQHKLTIEEKRNRLRDMLDNEQNLLVEEIKGLEETPEKIRQKMLERVTYLKTVKEEARQKFVAEQLERRFRDQADELRTVEGEVGELKTTYLRDIQMMEKHKLMEQEYQDEMIYSELWKRDILRKEKAEQEKLLELKKVNEERVRVLNAQKKLNEKTRQDQRDLREMEKSMLRHNWQEEAIKMKEQQIQQAKLNRSLNEQMLEHNKNQRYLKEAIVKQEKVADKQLIDENVHREQEMERLEKENKERIIKENREFLLNFMNRSDELKVYEKELERLIHEQSEEQWRKRAEVWNKEENARIQLMYQVYNNRDQEVTKKLENKEHGKIQKEKEKDQVTRDIIQYEKEIEDKRQRQYQRNKGHQLEIVSQAFTKEELKKMRLKEELEKEKADIQAQLEYIQWVKQEKEKGKQAIEHLRRQKLADITNLV